MLAIIELAGICVIAYFLILGVVMLFTQCSVEKARKMIASWWQENTSGSQTNDYELSRNYNYIIEVNHLIVDALGEARYQELCKLNKYSPIIYFLDNHDGLPTVQITLNCTDENERNRLEAMLEDKTEEYLSNYQDSTNVGAFSYWTQNRILHLPMLIIMYSRNDKERKMLAAKEQHRIRKSTARYSDVIDDTEEVDLF